MTGTVSLDAMKTLKCTRVYCMMVVSITKNIPYILKAIPIVKLTYEIICNGILNCLAVLFKGKFLTRAIISDNHKTNIRAFHHLSKAYPIFGKTNCIFNTHCSLQHIDLIFDTVHLIKNVRNNLLAARSFEVPQCKLTLAEKVHEFPSGGVYWACLHRVHEHDLQYCGKLRKAPKINFSVLHPRNNKLSVPLALAIFDPSKTTAIRSYFQKK